MAEVSQFGRLSYTKARPDIPLHRHFGIIEVHYRERGEQYWLLGDRTYQMEGGDLFVTMPDEVHSTGGHPVAPGIMYWFGVRLPPEGKGMLGLAGKESLKIIRRLFDIPCRRFRATSRIKPLLAEILQLHYSPEAFMRTVCMRQSMIRLLLEVIKAAEGRDNSRVSERMVEITRMIRNDPGQKYQLRNLAGTPTFPCRASKVGSRRRQAYRRGFSSWKREFKRPRKDSPPGTSRSLRWPQAWVLLRPSTLRPSSNASRP